MLTVFIARNGTMTESESTGVSTSMVITGSTVAIVGMILLITATFAFIMMIAFGVAVAALGLLISRRAGTRAHSELETAKDS